MPHIYLASAPPPQKKGVIIAVRDNVAFKHKLTIADPEGTYLILVDDLNNQTYTIVSLYAPNSHHLRFLKRLLNKISEIRKCALIICGDYNLKTDYTMDTTIISKRPLSTLQYTLHAEDLYDVWRCQHSNERGYSFHSSRHNIHVLI